MRQVPCAEEDAGALATPLGHLSAELARAPGATLVPLLALLGESERLAVGDYKCTSVPVLLFALRTASRVLCFARAVGGAEGGGEEDGADGADSADVDRLSAWVDAAAAHVGQWLGQATTAGARGAACRFHAHLAIATAPCVGDRFDAAAARRLVSSAAYLKTWHTAEHAGAGAGGGGGGEGEVEGEGEGEGEGERKGEGSASVDLGVGEQEMFWLVQAKRVSLQVGAGGLGSRGGRERAGVDTCPSHCSILSQPH